MALLSTALAITGIALPFFAWSRQEVRPRPSAAPPTLRLLTSSDPD